MERQTVSILHASQIVGVSRRTIYNWISTGKVQYARTASGMIRIFKDSLWRDAHGNQVPIGLMRRFDDHAKITKA